MKTSTTQDRNLSTIVSKIVMLLACATAVGALSMTPAYAKDHNDRNERNDREGYRDNGRHEGEYEGRRYRSGRNGSGWRRGYDDRDSYAQQRYYPHPSYYDRSYYYSQPVYVPPPVYYEPQPSPGVSFFFPLEIHRR